MTKMLLLFLLVFVKVFYYVILQNITKRLSDPCAAIWKMYKYENIELVYFIVGQLQQQGYSATNVLLIRN